MWEGLCWYESHVDAGRPYCCEGKKKRAFWSQSVVPLLVFPSNKGKRLCLTLLVNYIHNAQVLKLILLLPLAVVPS